MAILWALVARQALGAPARPAYFGRLLIGVALLQPAPSSSFRAPIAFWLIVGALPAWWAVGLLARCSSYHLTAMLLDIAYTSEP